MDVQRNRDGAPGSMPVIGVVRFSVLLEEAAEFALAKTTTLDERRAHLFDPHRLALRFRLFEAVTLPSVLAQQDRDWRLLVIRSTELPEPWRTRLDDLLAPHPNVDLVAMAPETRLSDVVRAEIRRHAPAPEAPVAVFRLDDDDGLAASFLGRLRSAIARHEGVGYAVSFANGHLISVTEDGRALKVVHEFRSFAIACGLTLVQRADAERTVFDLGRVHGHIDKVFPTWCDATGPAYILVSHRDNDTGTDTLRHRRLADRVPKGPNRVRIRLGPDFAHVRFENLLG